MSREKIDELNERLDIQREKLDGQKQKRIQLEYDARKLDARSALSFAGLKEFGNKLLRLARVARDASETMAQLEKEALIAEEWRIIDINSIFAVTGVLFFAFLLVWAFYDGINFAADFSTKRFCMNIICGIALSVLINFILWVAYRAFIDRQHEYISHKIYDIKPRKILLYSNITASALHILYAAVLYFNQAGQADTLSILLNILFSSSFWARVNIGGLIVTVYRFLTDRAALKEPAADGFKDIIHGK